MKPTTVSLVICTRNRAARLAPCLDALRDIEPVPGFEIVFVDNASTDETHATLSAFDCGFPVQLVQEPEPGLGRARNAGWKAAKGDIVAFTDDDCYVFPDIARRIAELFEDRSDLGFFGGRVMLHDPADLPVTIKESLQTEQFAPHSFIPAGAIHGANFGFRRSVLEALAGFDERLGAGTPFAAEDIEMAGRALGAGYAGIYSPGPAVSHHHGRKSPEERKKLDKFYDIGRGAYYACMLGQGTVRAQALRYWLQNMQIVRHPLRLARVIREIGGAIGYLSAKRSKPRAVAVSSCNAAQAERAVAR